MKNQTLSMAAYWRNSLADAELGKGGWHELDLSSSSVRPRFELTNASLDKQVTDEFFKVEPPEVQSIEVAFYPLLFKLKTEHGSRKQYALPSLLSPVVVKAALRRDGSIIPLPKVFIARDILEPLDRNAFSIGNIDDLDVFLTNNPCPVPANILHLAELVERDPTQDDEEDLSRSHERLSQIWKDLMAYCEQMLSYVCQDDMINASGYLRAREWLIRKIGGMEAPSRKISSLYDHLRQSNPDVPLLDTFSSCETQDLQPLLARDSAFDLHLGHCSDRYPLVDAQRDAMAHVLNMESSEILAVNGPPGTGKTTLLLSLVANMWVKAAIDGSNPPVVVATSTNNQAVTNIIDACKKDISQGEGPLAGRWISRIDSYGVYLSSRAKKQLNGTKYLTSDFLADFESVESIAQARDDYLANARAAFPDLVAPSVKSVVKRLHELLMENHGRLVEIKAANDSLSALQTTIKKALGDNQWEALQRIDQETEEAKNRYKVFENAYINLVNHLGNEPFWYDLLRFIPSVSRKQVVRASIVVKRTIKGIPHDKIWDNVDTLKSTLQERIQSLKATAQKHISRQRKAHALVNHVATAKNRLSEANKAVMDLELSCQPTEPESLSQANVWADTRIRFRMFLLATHYWEGRWLLEVDGKEAELLEAQGKQTPSVIRDRWYRRMMLTPCAVSTFFMLPGELRALHDDDVYRHDYLYNFIDMLIVDEAGQALPEVAGASFALAQKALVIGDTLQIEPIWNIPKSVDMGNLLHHGVIPEPCGLEEMEWVQRLGKTASSGNVMTIAQYSSRYHYDLEMPRGMFLYEHRRCFNEIIAYCNALSYKNKLIPARGRRQDVKIPPNVFPAMGYVNIQGLCKTKASGTRFNTIEANAVAEWIAHHRNELERLYQQRIEDIIGVVSPFTGQVEAIKASCKAQGIDVSAETGMTIGTVHSLQGAERPMVLFSPTYSRENNGSFIDASPSMLNVAVSRAKDNFIVFGDMRLFNPKQSFTPRGLLATFLFKSPENKIDGAPSSQKSTEENLE